MRWILASVAIAAIGCGDRSPTEPPVVAPPAVRVDASPLIAKYECNRCHDGLGGPPAPRDKHCVRCHQQIHAGTFADAAVDVDAALLAKWRGRITSLRWAPSLAGADRLRRAWVRDFLLAPHDLRPGLVAQMPRLAISRADAEQLAAHLVPDDRESAAAPSAADVASGERLYRGLGCARCHRFSGATVDDSVMHAAGRTQVAPGDGAWALAPDLRHARARAPLERLAAWIAAPRGAMPVLGIAPADARLLAAFVTAARLDPLPARAPVARLPLLSRPVRWDEVEARVFRNLCWHCHAVADYARGDGGPGNTGGFGFPPRGLDLSSYTGISSGSLDDAGEPRSVFAPLADGTPRVVAHLLARHAEAEGRVVDGVRGMPLGLPPLALEDIQLVETWIAQGRQR